ncbi:MAG: hypothetical protein Q7J65_01575 [Candidatus Marinimicrobia bacterium]|nr:hypothetical protein [Candidatus Neomarinimicrobiota bacterium]
MRKITGLMTIVLLLVGMLPLQAQLKSQLPKALAVEDAIQIPGVGSNNSLIGFIDPDRFFMNQSYSLSYSSFGGGTSMGVYQNQMSYVFSDKLMMNTRLGFMHNPLGIGSYSTGQTNLMDNLIYGFDLSYRPKDNVFFNIRFDKTPYYYRSGFYPYDYSIY